MKFLPLLLVLTLIGCGEEPKTNEELCNLYSTEFLALKKCHESSFCRLYDHEERTYRNAGILLVKYCARDSIDKEKLIEQMLRDEELGCENDD